MTLPKPQDDTTSVAATATATTTSNSSRHLEEPPSSLQFRKASLDLSAAAIVGLLTGLLVACFKLSIEAVRVLVYEQSWLVIDPRLVAVVPLLGGLCVGALLGIGGSFPPGLQGKVKEVDALSSHHETNASNDNDIGARMAASVRKTLAAVCTLGTGCSLGPEGPCVEIGMTVARTAMDVQTAVPQREDWNRRLLSCGAAAGVAAGFNAPVAGVFFALEVMGNTYSKINNDRFALAAGEVTPPSSLSHMDKRELSATERISPILLSSVLSTLASQTLLGSHYVLSLSSYDLKNPSIELPLYMILGIVSGGVAFSFSEIAKLSRSFFDETLDGVPNYVKPMIGGLFCGIVGVFYPQILFFGYETLNNLLSKKSLSIGLILTLLGVKTVTTAVSAGSGLVGGTFAPALFLGAMTGAAFHNGFTFLFDTVLDLQRFPYLHGMADLPAYAMIGAASVLAALFRAPLTASMVLFELTRDYEVILPLMVSAGLGSLVADILEDKFEQVKRRRDRDSVSWGDLSSQAESLEEDNTTATPSKEEVSSLR